mmetsp:Transcript_14734/g.55541  ORF Transcript_14734/g.55541 Transcript_14734/m.55541 type:complete len:217 (-) Transcript_14734:668-1318(-)
MNRGRTLVNMPPMPPDDPGAAPASAPARPAPSAPVPDDAPADAAAPTPVDPPGAAPPAPAGPPRAAAPAASLPPAPEPAAACPLVRPAAASSSALSLRVAALASPPAPPVASPAAPDTTAASRLSWTCGASLNTWQVPFSLVRASIVAPGLNAMLQIVVWSVPRRSSWSREPSAVLKIRTSVPLPLAVASLLPVWFSCRHAMSDSWALTKTVSCLS